MVLYVCTNICVYIYIYSRLALTTLTCSIFQVFPLRLLVPTLASAKRLWWTCGEKAANVRSLTPFKGEDHGRNILVCTHRACHSLSVDGTKRRNCDGLRVAEASLLLFQFFLPRRSAWGKPWYIIMHLASHCVHLLYTENLVLQSC